MNDARCRMASLSFAMERNATPTWPRERPTYLAPDAVSTRTFCVDCVVLEFRHIPRVR